MYTVYVMSCEGKGNFDVSTLAHDMTYTSSILGQPGKFTMTLEKDPNNILTMSVGDKIIFMDNGQKVFVGKVFTLGTDKTGAYTVTAYDQMRYLQNHDSLYLDGETNKSAEDMFVKICTQAGLTYQIKAPCPWILEPQLFIDQSYFDMLSWCFDKTNTENQKLFFIRDRGGILELNELGVNDTELNGANPLVIGDKSLLTDYSYEVDIDKETFTEVLLTESVKNSSKNSDKESTDKRLVYAKNDPEKAAKWGRLRKIVNVKEQASKEKLEEYAQMCLDVYSKSTKSMRLEALGYPVYAGDSFRLMLDKLKLCMNMYIQEATHTYGETHTMSLNIATNGFMPDTF